MKMAINVLICIVQIYIIYVLVHTFTLKQELRIFRPNRTRAALISLILINVLEFATVIHDIDRPGKQFPLEIRLPALALQTVLMLWAI